MAMTLLAVATASGDSTVEITTEIDSTYQMYEIYGTDIIPGTDATFLNVRVSTDGGSTWKQGASDYMAYLRGADVSVTGGTASSVTIGRGSVGERQGSAAGENGFVFVSIPNPAGSSIYQCLSISYTCTSDTGGSFSLFGGGAYMAASAIDGIQFFMSSGTITGEFRLYGIQKS